MSTAHRNPLNLLASKRVVSKSAAATFEQEVLVALTCAKASQGSAQHCNVLQKHLMVSAYIWNKHKNKVLYTKTVKGYNALIKAANRDTVLLDLSTTEYKEICAALMPYLAAIPKLEVGLYSAAMQRVEFDMMKEIK